MWVALMDALRVENWDDALVAQRAALSDTPLVALTAVMWVGEKDASMAAQSAAHWAGTKEVMWVARSVECWAARSAVLWVVPTESSMAARLVVQKVVRLVDKKDAMWVGYIC